MTNRLLVTAGPLLLAVLAACEHAQPTQPAPTRGALLDSAYLSLFDGVAPPCCGKDSAGVHLNIAGGALTFYRSLHYVDSMPVPSGYRIPVACVREVPNGATVYGAAGLVKYRDGTFHLLFPCDLGTYEMTLTRNVRDAGGTWHTVREVVSSGSFSQGTDTLTLTDTLDSGRLVTTVSNTTITVQSPEHQYQFVVPCAWCGS